MLLKVFNKCEQIAIVMMLKWNVLLIKRVLIRDGRFGSKVGQIGPKWDKSGAFSDQISLHLARGAKYTEI